MTHLMDLRGLKQVDVFLDNDDCFVIDVWLDDTTESYTLLMDRAFFPKFRVAMLNAVNDRKQRMDSDT